MCMHYRYIVSSYIYILPALSECIIAKCILKIEQFLCVYQSNMLAPKSERQHRYAESTVFPKQKSSSQGILLSQVTTQVQAKDYLAAPSAAANRGSSPKGFDVQKSSPRNVIIDTITKELRQCHKPPTGNKNSKDLALCSILHATKYGKVTKPITHYMQRHMLIDSQITDHQPFHTDPSPTQFSGDSNVEMQDAKTPSALPHKDLAQSSRNYGQVSASSAQEPIQSSQNSSHLITELKNLQAQQDRGFEALTKLIQEFARAYLGQGDRDEMAIQVLERKIQEKVRLLRNFLSSCDLSTKLTRYGNRKSLTSPNTPRSYASRLKLAIIRRSNEEEELKRI